MNNLFNNIPIDIPEELIETLVKSEKIKIERFVSMGQVSPDGFWYDQTEAEFVLVLQGEGHVAFEDGQVVKLQAGEWLNIEAHRKHRVVYTSKEPATIWLAVSYG